MSKWVVEHIDKEDCVFNGPTEETDDCRNEAQARKWARESIGKIRVCKATDKEDGEWIAHLPEAYYVEGKEVFKNDK